MELSSKANAPTSGNDYSTNLRVNSPHTNSPVAFTGNSLRVDTGGNLQIRSNDGANDALTMNLILNGGRFGLNQNTADGSFKYALKQGTISVTADSVIKLNQDITGQRNLQIDSLISGSNTLQFWGSAGFTGPRNVFVSIQNSNNTFDGIWEIKQVRAIFEDAGATGTGHFRVLDEGYLRIDSSWTGSISAITGAEVEVRAGNSYTFSSLNVGGTEYSTAGSYTAAELNALTSSDIFTGGGTYVMIPEPATCSALLGLAGIGLMSRRRLS